MKNLDPTLAGQRLQGKRQSEKTGREAQHRLDQIKKSRNSLRPTLLIDNCKRQTRCHWFRFVLNGTIVMRSNWHTRSWPDMAMHELDRVSGP
jgi:hypothetical protein